jgi:hypothetical protein
MTRTLTKIGFWIYLNWFYKILDFIQGDRKYYIHVHYNTYFLLN